MLALLRKLFYARIFFKYKEKTSQVMGVYSVFVGLDHSAL